MLRRLALLTVPALVVPLAALIAPSAANAAVGTTFTLGLTGYHRTVVAGGKVFILGAPSDGIAVRNADGSSAGVNIETGATDIVASANGTQLFVALDTANAVAVVNTSTLVETIRYATGTDTCPQSVSALGTTIWFGYGCSDAIGTSHIGAVDTSQNPAVVTLALSGNYYSAPILRSIDSLPTRLFAVVVGMSPSTVQSYAVSGTALTANASVDVGSNLQDMAITPDGADLITASGSPYDHPSFHTSDLSPDLTYGSSNPYPNAVATSSTGFVAAGVNASYSPDIYIYAQNATFVRSYDFGTSDNIALVAAGLAFGADGSALYAVTNEGSGAIQLHVISGSTLLPSAVTLTGPATSIRTKPLSLTGTLTSGGAALPGVTIHVSRKNIDGTKSLSSVLTSGTGQFTIHDSPTVGGPVTYTATSTADVTHASASRTFTVAVSRVTPTVTVTTDHTTYGYHATVHITAHLGTTYKNRKLTIYITQYGHAKTALRSNVTVDSHGNVTASFVGSLNTVVTAYFTGDEIYGPVSASKRVAVAAALSEAMVGYYQTSGSYYVFHEVYGGGMVATVAPHVALAGRHVCFVIQGYRSGQWVTAVQTFCGNLDSTSKAAEVFDGSHGYHFRTRAEFHGDAANAAKTGAWRYMEFT
jgi:hypothetical protein